MTFILPELVPLKYVYEGTNDLSAHTFDNVVEIDNPLMVAFLFAQQAFNIVAHGSPPEVQVSEGVDTRLLQLIV